MIGSIPDPNESSMKGSASEAVRVLGRFPFACPPHSPLVGRVVNLEGARLLFRRVLDNLAVFGLHFCHRRLKGSAWSLGFPFLQPILLCQPGLTFCYELAEQRWIEGQIDLSGCGIGPSIHHGAYSTLTD